MTLSTKKSLNVGGTLVPNLPFVWYREEQMMASIEYFDFITKNKFIEMCSKIGMKDLSKFSPDDNRTQFTVSIQRHVLDNANIYISLHGYAYYKETNKTVLNGKYNRNFKFSVYSESPNDTINFVKLKKDQVTKGGVHIHDKAFSPAGQFHFKIKKGEKVGYLVTNAKCPSLNCSVTSLFIILNDVFKDVLKIENLIPFKEFISIVSHNNTATMSIAEEATLDLGKFGFSNKLLTDTLKNKKLSSNLARILTIINELDDAKEIDQFKDMFYGLAGKLNKIDDEKSIEVLISYILDGHIDTKKRLAEGINYMTKIGYYESISELTTGLDSAIGLGIVISKDDIVSEINRLIDLVDNPNWSNWGKILKNTNDNLKWADGKLVKETIDEIFIGRFGERVKGKKPKKEKKNVKIPEKVEEPVNTFDTFELPKPEENLINTEERLKEHLEFTGGKVMTRFPPEPNGHLHIGHCKAMFINFGYALKKNGECYLRFDDTNPEKEKQEYIDSIIEDVTWMGYKPWKITYTSDYFDELIDLAFELIKRDGAYVCELSSEKMREDRMNGVDSPYRNRPIEESFDLFTKMIAGEFEEGKYTLRMKMDMSSDNPNMRDHVAYRIMNKEHPRTGDKYKVYPSYDYSHCLVDSLENITHSLCSMEFQTRNESYQWLLEKLGIYRPIQIEYVRLNVTNVMLSKRKLIELVESGIVSGWDDPRLPTIKGLKRRGYTQEAIKEFCSSIGVNIGGSSGMVDYGRLENCVRQNLDETAPRKMMVSDPLKVVILNREGREPIKAMTKDMPRLGDESSTRALEVGHIVYIDRSDFSLNPGKKYFRLKAGGVVRLKYAFPVRYIGHKLSGDEVTEVHVEEIPEGETKIKGTITWVPENSVNVEIREFNHMFPEELPDSDNWIDHINKDSVKVSTGLVEPSLIEDADKVGNKYQFERVGFFAVDNDSTKEKPVFNKIVDLKESKDKYL